MGLRLPNRGQRAGARIGVYKTSIGSQIRDDGKECRFFLVGGDFEQSSMRTGDGVGVKVSECIYQRACGTGLGVSVLSIVIILDPHIRISMCDIHVHTWV